MGLFKIDCLFEKEKNFCYLDNYFCPKTENKYKFFLVFFLKFQTILFNNFQRLGKNS